MYSKELNLRGNVQSKVIHPRIVRAEDGQKMSKSFDNGVDPMDVIDKYGADALRYFLSTGSSPGQDLRFSYDKVEAVPGTLQIKYGTRPVLH